MTWSGFKKVLEENIGKNLKKMVALIGDVIIAVMMVAIFAMKNYLDLPTTMIMILLVIAPYIRHYVELIFKGEVSELQQNNLRISEQLSYEREISEYRCELAAAKGEVPKAIVANKTWYDANTALEIATLKAEIKTLETKLQ